MEINMADKHYNPRYLRGETDYTDDMFQQDMAAAGIDIPSDVLGTPKLHLVAAEQVRQQSKQGLTKHVNPDTQNLYTQEEADAYADAAYESVIDKMSSLSGEDLRKLK